MARRPSNTRSSSSVSATSAATTETGPTVQEEMFRSLLKTPHRQTDEILAAHKQQFERDPNFYGKLAFWAVGLENCSVRDINEAMLAVLFDSQYPEHKEAAYVMLQNMPPYEVFRVGNMFTGYDEMARYASYEKDKPVDGKFGVKVEPAKFGKSCPDKSLIGKPIPRREVDLNPKSQLYKDLLKKGLIKAGDKKFYVDALLVKHPGLGNKRYKGMLKHAIRSYLKIRERDRSQMEGAILRAKDCIRRLYAKSNLLPQGDEKGWINQFLFHGKAEPGTRLFALQKLAKSKNPTEQSEIIIENKIPYPLAVSVISNITPSVLVSLIDVMSPQELMSNLSALQKRGAMDNAEIKALIDSKLKSAQKKGRVDALKGAVAAKVQGLDESIKKAVLDVTDRQIKKHGCIKARTLLMIDKSGSMSRAIEIGKEIGACIAQACNEGNPPTTYLFDAQPIPVAWKDSDGDITTKSSWDKKFQMFRASGGTCPASVVKALLSSNKIVDQIVVVTDEGENNDGEFARALKDYEQKTGVLPSVVIVRVGTSCDRMFVSCQKKGITVDAMACESIDNISIPNLIQMLSRKSVFDLVQEILTLDLPNRNQFDSTHGLVSL